MKIAVVDYGIGNLRSAQKALLHVGADATLVSNPQEVTSFDAVILPGVGSFGQCATALHERGWKEPLHQAIASGTPFLGICVGFQLLYEGSQESPGAIGLGVFSGEVERLPDGVRHPQIQWNQLAVLRPTQLLDENDTGSWMYFVHSFAPPISGETVAVCEYGGPVVAAVAEANVYGAQFHPEKSGLSGLQFLRRFAQLAEDQ